MTFVKGSPIRARVNGKKVIVPQMFYSSGCSSLIAGWLLPALLKPVISFRRFRIRLPWGGPFSHPSGSSAGRRAFAFI